MPFGSTPDWARQWHKFFVERVGIDSMQLGLLLLTFLSLITLFLSIMSVSVRFCCCCARRVPRHRKSSAATVPNQMPPSNGFFTCTNEERRCLLQSNGVVCNANAKKPIKAQTIPNNIDKQLADGGGGGGGGEQPQQQRERQAVSGGTTAQPLSPTQEENIVAIVVDTVQHQSSACQRSSTPLTAQRTGGHLLLPHLPTAAPYFLAESPPVPRRFANAGRTQVLPLTSQNCRRVAPLVMLLTEQQQNRQQQLARGRVLATPAESSRVTTTTNGSTTMKSCATILEDPEEARILLSDELLSIDRTFVSMGDEHHQQQEMSYVAAAHRLPIHQPPPKFEVQPPSYSPPDPPCKMMSINFWRDSTNFSRCSYGGAQTPLNTTTGSSSVDPSVDSILHATNNHGVEVRISEMDSEIVGYGNTVPVPGHAVPGGRVPRSISQQLELMNMSNSS